jgi:hypothetical protein
MATGTVGHRQRGMVCLDTAYQVLRDNTTLTFFYHNLNYDDKDLAEKDNLLHLKQMQRYFELFSTTMGRLRPSRSTCGSFTTAFYIAHEPQKSQPPFAHMLSSQIHRRI